MTPTDRVYVLRCNNYIINVAIDDARKYSKWGDKEIANLVDAIEWFKPASRNSLNQISRIPESSEDHVSVYTRYWFNILLKRGLISKIWYTTDYAIDFFGIREKLSKIELDDIKCYPQWSLLSYYGGSTDTRDIHAIWFSSELNTLSAALWIACDQNFNRFKGIQSRVASDYSNRTRYASGFSPVSQFEELLLATFLDSKDA